MASRRSSDAAILSQLIGLHYDRPPVTLDATWGRGAIWRGCPYQPTTRVDRRPVPGVDTVGEWHDLPLLFGPAAFELVVWDPPHMTDGGKDAMSGTWDESYGIGQASLSGHLNISYLYPEFLHAAAAVLTPAGTLLAKIADQVHGAEQQLQAVDFVVAARAAGWTVCEMVPKMRQPGPLDPKWRRQYHVRKAWSYWICAHPGDRCPAVGVALVMQCQAPKCGRDFRAERSTAQYCSDACNERARYYRKSGAKLNKR